MSNRLIASIDKTHEKHQFQILCKRPYVLMAGVGTLRSIESRRN